MRRLFLLLALAASIAGAQAPTDTLVAQLAERDAPQKRFMRDNPDATEFLRNERATHFRKADGTLTALVGSTLNYVDADSQLQPIAPELWQTSAGFRQIGTPTPIRIVATSPNQDTIEIWNGTRVASVTTSKLTKTGNFTWTFPWSQITWTMELRNDGWNVTSEPIASARGLRTYQMPLASTGLNPVPDADGNLVDGTFKITRAVMARADKVQTPCSAWAVGSKAVSFTCDDSALPAAAFPYVIDPTATFSLSADVPQLFGYYSYTVGEPGWCHSPNDTYYGSFTAGTLYASYRCTCDASDCYTTHNRTVLDFLTGSLPAGAAVTSASLSVHTQVNSALRENLWRGPDCGVSVRIDS